MELASGFCPPPPEGAGAWQANFQARYNIPKFVTTYYSHHDETIYPYYIV